MKVTFQGGSLHIDVIEMLAAIPDDDKLKFVEALSCEEAIVRHVADQIIHGCTENGFNSCSASAHVTPFYAIDEATRSIGLASSDIANREIKRLIQALQLEKQSNQQLRDLLENTRRQF